MMKPDWRGEAEKIASESRDRVIFAASTTLANFSGHRRAYKRSYEALVTRIHDVTADGIGWEGNRLGKDRPGLTFLQGPAKTKQSSPSTGEPCTIITRRVAHSQECSERSARQHSRHRVPDAVT